LLTKDIPFPASPQQTERNPAMARHLYCHVPFCRRKCAYCAFYSLPDPAPGTIARYLQRLAQSVMAAAADLPPLQTVYFGGGTPTSLAPAQLRELLNLLDRCALDPGAEISIECNPDTLDDHKAEILASRVNRVSLGVQSFFPNRRRQLGRHGLQGVNRAVQRLLAHGIANLNIDLIYGIPGQTLADWQKELDRALELPISHLSAYALTVEEGSFLARRSSLKPADESLLADLWEYTGERLAAAGLPRYEISNYARPGAECRHHLAVWLGQPYLGLGPAASSFDGRTRWSYPPDLDFWLTDDSRRPDRLSPQRRAREIFAFGLRTVQGWQSATFRQAAGDCHWQDWRDRLQPLIAAGLLEADDQLAACTRRGLLVWDEIAQAIL